MKNILKIFTKKDKGMFTVEATLIFPIIFFCTIILIFIGILLYQQVTLQSLASQAASRGAVMYATRTSDMENGTRKLEDFADSDPYRYIWDTQLAKAQKTINSYVSSRTNSNSVIDGDDVSGTHAVIENYFITKKVRVTTSVDYNKNPASGIFAMFGAKDLFSIKTGAVATVSDPVEFIRNTDMCVDVLTSIEGVQKALTKLSEVNGKVTELLGKIKVEDKDEDK